MAFLKFIQADPTLPFSEVSFRSGREFLPSPKSIKNQEKNMNKEKDMEIPKMVKTMTNWNA